MSQLYFRQLMAGRDFGRDDPTCAQMANFVYAIGDAENRRAVLVDPAWDIEALLRVLEEDEMDLDGVLATHYHPDHIGGEMFGWRVEGLPRLLELKSVPIHVHEAEAAGVQQVTQISRTDLSKHAGGERISVGDIEIELIHTPGHTPGSQCFLVDNRLVSGDTLFVRGCGRVDLPGSDPDEMFRTLTQRLAKLGDGTVLYPGHHYGPEPSSTLGSERQLNHYLRIRSLDDWRRLMNTPF